jgi:hypothetical protein
MAIENTNVNLTDTRIVPPRHRLAASAEQSTEIGPDSLGDSFGNTPAAARNFGTDPFSSMQGFQPTTQSFTPTDGLSPGAKWQQQSRGIAMTCVSGQYDIFQNEFKQYSCGDVSLADQVSGLDSSVQAMLKGSEAELAAKLMALGPEATQEQVQSIIQEHMNSLKPQIERLAKDKAGFAGDKVRAENDKKPAEFLSSSVPNIEQREAEVKAKESNRLYNSDTYYSKDRPFAVGEA